MIGRVYEVVQHTADVRILVAATTVERLFEDALLGLMDVIRAERASGETTRETVPIESVDRTALLIDFLNYALTQCHLHRRRYTAASFASLGATSLSATLTSVPAGDLQEDVKAVTYHEADVRRGEDGMWRTTLVLDI